MKTITKTTKAIMVALLAMILCVAMAFTLAACNNDEKPSADGITKYDATLDASITMGAAGPQQLGSNIVKGTYITLKDGKYTLTLIMDAGEMTVFGITKNVFIDDNPENPQTTEGIKDGTVGIYKTDGTLVTEGIKLTYSSGDNYESTPSGKNVYYVKSVEFPIDSVRESYDLTMFFNSPMMGKQFSNATYKVTLKLNLQSGTAVETISGYGVATRGEAPQPEYAFTKYNATLESKVQMGQQSVDFGAVLIDGAYVSKNGEQYSLTVIFKTSEITIYGNPCKTFIDSQPNNAGTSSGVTDGTIGFYKEDGTLVNATSLTYSTNTDYVSNSDSQNVYYVKSATFAIDGLRETYKVAVYVNSDVRGVQFNEANEAATGKTYSAVITLDLENGEGLNSIDNLLGVSTRGEAPQPEEQPAYTQYDAQLSCYITAMGGVEFGNGILSGVYVEKDEDQYYMTLIFAKSQVTIYTITCDTFVDTPPVNAGTSKGVTDGTIGFYSANGTLVTEGIEVSYSSGDDYAANSSGNVYYVKSVTLPIDELRETYKLALYINSSVMGVQFCEASEAVPTGTYSATLTLDLESGTGVESIDNLIGVPVRGEVPKPVQSYNVTISGFETAEGTATLNEQKESYEEGSEVTLVVTPAMGHGIEKVTVGGQTVSLNGENAYTFEVTGNTAINVEFNTQYQVPIVSLVSSAPLPAVKAAFNSALGENATLIVKKDGSMRLRLQNKHMKIDMTSMGMGNYDANIAWVQGATVLSTKEEVFSNVHGSLVGTPTQDNITVPDVFEIAYSSDCNGVMTLTIGVDFMAKMNNKEIDEYSTTVTLTIDVSSLNLETAE